MTAVLIRKCLRFIVAPVLEFQFDARSTARRVMGGLILT
jgi:hypothetical protein